MSFVPILTERLVLRALTVNDGDAVFAILGDRATTANVSWGLDDPDDGVGWLRRRLDDEATAGFSMWAVERRSTSGIIGFCGFFATDGPGRVELGYVIHADQWGQGFGAEAAHAAVEAAAAAGLGVVATIRSSNERSLRVAQRIGLHQTGTVDDDRGVLLVWESAGNEGPSSGPERSVAEVRLEGGWQTDVRRHGEVVFRAAGPQSATVLRLLAHLEANGFDAAPRPVGTGFAVDGREQLTFVEGVSPQPLAWSGEEVWRIGDLLRRLHAATASFVPGPDAVWRPWFARDLPGDRRVIGHGDLGPWNILARDGVSVAFIDWDNAGPVDARWELAQVTWLNAQLHDDDVAGINDLPDPVERIRQAAAIVDGYQLPAKDRAGLVEMMIEFAVRSARDEAIAYAVGPVTVSPAADGFPTLWAVTWRTRAAAWMLDHRADLDRALRS